MEKMQVSFCAAEEVADSLFRYAVIAARQDGRWIFCRHHARQTWEIPGGHREPEETLEQTARRELWEETGALDFTLFPICAYCASAYGMLYYAEVRTLGALPEGSEIAEISTAYGMPAALTYPQIQPALFHRVQGWLNLRANADELWDVYDAGRRKTGALQRRGDPMAAGAYHLVVQVFLRNSRGEYLITRRAPEKGYGGMWETTGGSALAGDDSLAAALREVREETGFVLDPSCGERKFSLRREHDFCDIWLFCQDFLVEDAVLQAGETDDVMYATSAQILAMREAGEFVPLTHLEESLAAFERE